jgi:membrane fusion protein, multidrug efflux system
MNQTDTQGTAECTREQGPSRPGIKVWGGVTALVVLVAAAVVVGPRLLHGSPASAVAAPAAPAVTVSQPLQKELRGRIQLLGQFSAVDQVELRAQVGGTLTYIGFKDGDIVRKGELLFIIDPTPYQIRVDQSTAQVAKARARLELATQELSRAQTLQKTDAGSVENVEQRLGEERSAQAALDEAEALVRDAKFDLDHTRILAPFSGRIGTHLVSVGNLISGNRGGGNATTLLGVIVSLDPIYLNFDMSEADYLTFQRERTSQKAALANKVEVSLGDEARFTRQGILNFVDNTLDRSSGTIHTRATVSNRDLFLTPGAFGRVRINLSTPRQVLLVPDASVAADQTDRVALVVGPDDVVKAKKVQTGGLRYGLRVIYSGLNSSDRLIVGGGPTVAPGTKTLPRDEAIVLGSDEGQN